MSLHTDLKKRFEQLQTRKEEGGANPISAALKGIYEGLRRFLPSASLTADMKRMCALTMRSTSGRENLFDVSTG
jgi:hypothetical protein